MPQSMTPSGKALWTAGRPLFFNAANSTSWPADAFPWQPTLEAASFLSTKCKNRVLKVSKCLFELLVGSGEADARAAGAVLQWQAGAVLVCPEEESLELRKSTCPAIVCLLHGGLIRRCARAGAVGHLSALMMRDAVTGGYPREVQQIDGLKKVGLPYF
eukprot:symbB.v1.2.012188.t1/scaffold835.1/size159100/15